MSARTIETPPPAPWSVLLVDVVFVPFLPLALVLAVSAGWAAGSFLGAVVIAAVFFIDRGTESPGRHVFVCLATMLYVAFDLLWIDLGTTFSCREPTHTWVAYAVAGAVFVGFAGLSLWRRFLWGIPIAVLLALIVFFAVYSRLPGLYPDCSD